MKLTVQTFLTLDGVMQAPGGPEEDPSDAFTHGGWQASFPDPAVGEFVTELNCHASVGGVDHQHPNSVAPSSIAKAATGGGGYRSR